MKITHSTVFIEPAWPSHTPVSHEAYRRAMLGLYQQRLMSTGTEICKHTRESTSTNTGVRRSEDL